MAFNESEIQYLPAGRHAVGYHGLAILVRFNPASGRFSRTWVQRVQVDGKPTNAGIGSAKKVTLREAKAKARANATAHDKGRSLPHAPRASGSAVRTFSDAVDGYIGKKRASGEWTGARVEESFRRSVMIHGRALLNRRVDAIEPAMVYDVLMKLAATPATLHITKGDIESVFRWAKALGFCGTNPCEDLNDALPRRPKSKARKAIGWQAIPDALAKLRESMPGDYRVDALELLVLTSVRTVELAKARIEDFNLKSGIWIVRAETTKKRREHVVPLCDRAMELVRNLAAASRNEYLVPGSTRATETLDPQWFVRTLRKHGIQCDAHGMRGTFGSWAEEAGYSQEVITAALSHAKDSTTGAYLRGSRLEERRDLMAAYAKALAA